MEEIMKELIDLFDNHPVLSGLTIITGLLLFSFMAFHR